MPSRSITENTYFLVREVEQQIRLLLEHADSPQTPPQLLDRQGYIQNLATSVQNLCIAGLSKKVQEREQLRLRCYYNMAATLGEISLSCTHMLNELGEDRAHLNEVLASPPMLKAYRRAAQAITLVKEVVTDSAEQGMGRKICEISQNLNERNGKILKRLSRFAEEAFEENPKGLLLFTGVLFRFYMDLCNQIMKLGEIVLSLEHNDMLTLRQYQSLNHSLENLSKKGDYQEAALDKLAETKSGCIISGVQVNQGTDYAGVLKEGKTSKILKEKEKIEYWGKVMPGIAPGILAFDEHEHSAALLIEFIEGQTFEQIMLTADIPTVQKVTGLALDTLERVWVKSRRDDLPGSAGFMTQLDARLKKVFLIHDEFEQGEMRLENLAIPSIKALVARCAGIEETLAPRFSVYSHGDFNIDNLIYDADRESIRFIDLHRSGYTDYLQDATVFMLSNLRFLNIAPNAAYRVNQVIPLLMARLEKFARANKDRYFTARLALGLARSFISSTRFIYDDAFALHLFLKGRYLLEKVEQHPQESLHNFTFPMDVLYAH